MKKILGLDIGTNSIGWAFINFDDDTFEGKIIGLGSRIIPTDSDLLGKFETGKSASKNADRRAARGSRRLKQRYKLRRKRLIDVLKILKWLPENFESGHEFPCSQALLDEMKLALNVSAVSKDWVVYYLRHKALTEKIELHDLARILYHLNQRRGFKSNRKANPSEEITGDDDNNDGRPKREKKIEIVSIIKIEETEIKNKGYKQYNIYLNDGRIGTTLRNDKPGWEGEMELEITTIPPTKKDAARFEFRIPDKTDWLKLKESREEEVKKYDLQLGAFYFTKLKEGLYTEKNYVIKDIPVDRKLYVDELIEILKTQSKYHPGLLTTPVIAVIAEKLYPHNLDKQKEIKNNDLQHLLVNDIIYYQRPLKSQKNSIAECRFEKRNYRLPDGKLQGVKVAPISSPAFQEFRIWQTINNIKVLQRNSRDKNGNLQLDYDVSWQYINTENIEKLFELFDGKEKVNQKQILKVLGNLDDRQYMINIFRNNEEKEIPGNETKSFIKRILKKCYLDDLTTNSILNNSEKYFLLWHILYSLDEENNISKALQKQFHIEESKANIIAKAPAFKQQYASLSTKAINKLLPLMRTGKYWNWENISTPAQHRIQNILHGEYDIDISNSVRDLFVKGEFNNETHFQGLQMPMAAYTVYGMNSEKDKIFYDEPKQIKIIDAYELRNPIVTQVVNETLRLVQSIWNNKDFGRPDEIHIELARDIKKNAKEREKLSKQIAENERENLRIATILRELKEIGGNPNSFSDIEKLKLWEKQTDKTVRDNLKEIKFKKPSEPTKDEISKYKLWCEQNHMSPYSGKIIPIHKLFTKEYEVDHIMPRSRYFDDSFENKVVVESFLNKDKDNRTAYEYITGESKYPNHRLNPEEFETHVNWMFYGKKKKLLLSLDIPEGFINRQMNDTRHINRKLIELLSPIAKCQNDPIIVTNGSITGELRHRWGLGEKMKDLVKWRFERLQEKTGNQLITCVDEKDTGKKIMKLEGFEKRIDHRHHALDALVVACTTRKHIKYLSTLNAQRDDVGLRAELENILINLNDKTAARKFMLPWKTFIHDSMQSLSEVIISFKNRIPIYGKRKNKYLAYAQNADGIWVKQMKYSEKKSPSVKQSLHKATFAGKISLREYKYGNIDEAINNPLLIANKDIKHKITDLLKLHQNNIKKLKITLKENPLNDKDGNVLKKIDIIEYNHYFVNRVALNTSFDEKKIGKIPDKVLTKELLQHLKSEKYNGDPKKAFDAEGIETFNKNRKYPIWKVRIKEESSSKFEISKGKWVEADKGTNLFFAVYVNNDNPSLREFASIPLRDVIEAKINDSNFVEEKLGFNWFLLSPNDLVYLPDEHENISAINWEKDKTEISKKVYKLVSVNKGQAFFVPHTVSKVIIDKVEFDSLNKIERANDGRMIKQHCIKLHVDRLGNIKPV